LRVSFWKAIHSYRAPIRGFWFCVTETTQSKSAEPVQRWFFSDLNSSPVPGKAANFWQRAHVNVNSGFLVIFRGRLWMQYLGGDEV
jgi:hypothetical protein